MSQGEREFIEFTGIDRLSAALSRAGGCMSLRYFAPESKPVLNDLRNRKDEILSAVDKLLLPGIGFDQAMTVMRHCYRLSAGTNIFSTLTSRGWERAPTIRVLANFFDSLQKNNHATACEVGEMLLEQFPSSAVLLDEMSELSRRGGEIKRSRLFKEKAEALRSSPTMENAHSLADSSRSQLAIDSLTTPKKSATREPTKSSRGQVQSARSRIITRNLNLAGPGLEIGPLHRPIVRKTEGDVKFLDRVDTEALKDKFRHHPNILEDDIEDVDFVLVESDLRRAIPKPLVFDYVIASHVIQQVPNLVAFLQQIDSILKPGGIVSLAIPDKRYCFDLLKESSKLGEVLAAYHDNLKRPSFLQVFNHMSEVANISGPEAWRGHVPDPIHGKKKAYQIAQESQKPGHYSDVHCWTFTPRSFQRLIEELRELKLISLGISEIIPTRKDTNEFFVQLRRV